MADIKSLNGYALKDAQARETVAALTATVTSQGNTVSNLQTTVGQQATVLTQHSEAISQHGADISGLKTAVGGTTSGLTKAVADNTAAINTLNGTGDGSVAKAIQDAKPGYASTTTAGVVKVGENLSIDENGVLSASMGSTVVVDDALDNASTNPVQNKVVTAAITQNTTDISNLDTSVSTLRNVVGTSSSGLVKDVNDNATAISTLQTTVGNSTTGLVKDVNDNATAIATINGDDTGMSMRDVAEDVASAIPKSITPKGTVTFANLPSLASSEIGDMYNVSDSFTTTADFVMGAGVDMNANSNVYVINDGTDTAPVKKWDVFATQGIADMSAYQTKTLTSHTGITATTVEGALEEIADNIDDVESDVSALQTTVGDSTAGLVKSVADNAAAITSLQTTVGDSTAGLVKSVADNAAAITSLQTTVGDSTAGLVKSVADNGSAIADLTTALADKQGTTLSAPITIRGTSCTTVEQALNEIATFLNKFGTNYVAGQQSNSYQKVELALVSLA